MNVTFGVGEAELDVELSLPERDATVAELVTALADGPLSDDIGLLVDGRFVPSRAPASAAGLKHGSFVELARGPRTRPTSLAVVEVRVVGGVASGARFPLAPGTFVVGRDDQSDVVIESPTVSARHARLTVGADGSVVIEDLGSTNGTRVDGRFVKGQHRTVTGQLLQLGAVQLVCASVADDDVAAALAVTRRGVVPFNRPPRRMPPGPAAPVRLPAPPPEPPAAGRFGWAALIAPLVMGAVMAVMWDPRFALFCLLTPVMMIGNWIEERRRSKKDRRKGTAEFRRAIADLRQALVAANTAERARRFELFPDLAEVARRATAPSTRVWERRAGHPDFLRLRVGVGAMPWEPPVVDTGGERPPEVDEVIAEHALLEATPLDVNLTAGRCLGLVGSRAAAVAVLRGLVCQATTLHGPADVRVAIITDPERLGDWDWAKWLPHARSEDEASGRYLLAADGTDREAVLADLAGRATVSERRLGSEAPPSGPTTILVVDAEGVTEGRNARARDLLGGAGGPVAGVIVAPSIDRLPALCTDVVELRDADGTARYTEPASGRALDGVLVAGATEGVARACGRALAGLEDPEVAEPGSNLPDSLSLLSVLRMEEPSPDAVLARWSSAGRLPRIAAPIGYTEHGPFIVDLVSDGPHGLVAGTTGSGKSELLRTLVASLAASVDPDHLNFVLIDYKGGSAFDACASLPHTVGMVTDLDEHLGRRALRCLEAELRYRERRLRDAGVSDLPEYLASGAREPLPRLLVVIDEFAAMAADLPDFIDALVDMAQRGRSLGVHLLLATQRPSGVVNDRIRANTNLRIALRVQDVHDSTDVINAPSAAHIGRHRAGRGYVRLGPGELVPFQAALSTGVTTGEAESHVDVTPFGFGAQPGIGGGRESDRRASAPSDLALLVAAAGEAAERAGFRPARRPWPGPLGESVVLDDVVAAAAGAEPSPWSAPVGIVDEPEHQRQRPFWWERGKGNAAIYGVAGSGTTTALATLAVSLAGRYRADELHVYVLDFGTQALAALDGLPHVGAVVGADDRDRQVRLVRHLRRELERRRRIVADGGVVVADRPGAGAAPAVLLLVDNYPAFKAAFDDAAGEAVYEDFVRIVSDGSGLGINVVMTADRANGIPMALGNLLPEKLVFRLPDRYDYSNFGLNPADVPKLTPGRCTDAETKLEVQIALPGGDGLAEAVRRCPAKRVRRSGPTPIGVLSDDVTVDDIVAAAAVDGDTWFIPVGVGDNELKPAGFALGPGDHALVVGPGRAGKSSTLAAIADVTARQRPDVTITAIALRRSPLCDASAVGRLATDVTEANAVLAAVAASSGPQLVLVDDAEMFDDDDRRMADLLSQRRPDVHVIAAGRADGLRGLYGHWTAEIRRSRLGFALRPQDMDSDLWNAMLPRHRPPRMGAGRGYLLLDGHAELMQAAHP